MENSTQAEVDEELELLRKLKEEILPTLKIDPERDEKLTPLNKIDANLLDLHKPNVCLMLCGSFYPPHLNHIRAIEKAREVIISRGFNVLGCFLTPTHQSSLKRKFGSKILKKDIREQMCREAVKAIPWLGVDFFLLLNPVNKGVVYAKNRLQTLVNKRFTNQSVPKEHSKNFIKVLSVVGFDTFPILQRKLEREQIIFVNNRPGLNSGIDIEKEIDANEHLRNFKHNAIVINDSAATEMSSTLIREKINQNKQLDKYLPQSLLEYVKKNRIRFSTVNPLSELSLKDDHDQEKEEQIQGGQGEEDEDGGGNNSDSDNEERGTDKRKDKNKKEASLKKGKSKEKPKDKKKLPPKGNPTPEFTGIKNLNEIINFPFTNIQYDKLRHIINPATGKPTLLGKGLQASVYLMEFADEQGNNGIEKVPVAVKIFDLTRQKAGKIKAFKCELRALNRLFHKNLIKLYGAGTVQKELYFVLEKASTTAWDYLKNKKAEWTEGLPLHLIKAFAELAEGCSSMAKAGVFHRDLQMNNILVFYEGESRVKVSENNNKAVTGTKEEEEEEKVEENGKVEDYQREIALKLTDFGVAGFEEDSEHTVRGSMRHYAPEAILDKSKYCEKSDVFSFGLLVWEFLHCRTVWKSKKVEETCFKTLKKEKPRFKVPCQEELKMVLEQCWEYNLEKRPRFAEVAELLRKVHASCLKKI